MIEVETCGMARAPLAPNDWPNRKKSNSKNNL